MDKQQLANDHVVKMLTSKPLFAAQLEKIRNDKQQLQTLVDEIAENIARPKLELKYRNAIVDFEIMLYKIVLRY
jgi:hypothetical protein